MRSRAYFIVGFAVITVWMLAHMSNASARGFHISIPHFSTGHVTIGHVHYGHRFTVTIHHPTAGRLRTGGGSTRIRVRHLDPHWGYPAAGHVIEPDFVSYP